MPLFLTGVYANGFADGPHPPPGPQARMRVGDILVSLDGKDVMGATLPVALAAIETARRRVRWRGAMLVTGEGVAGEGGRGVCVVTGGGGLG